MFMGFACGLTTVKPFYWCICDVAYSQCITACYSVGLVLGLP